MLLKQFRSFYARNFPDEMEQMIEYFAVFGGLDEAIDLHLPLETLIREEQKTKNKEKTKGSIIVFSKR